MGQPQGASTSGKVCAMKSGGWRNSLTAPQSHAELDSLWGRAFNIIIAGRAAGTPTHVSHACIRRLPAVSLRDRVKVGRGNLYAHVERAGAKATYWKMKGGIMLRRHWLQAFVVAAVVGLLAAFLTIR